MDKVTSNMRIANNLMIAMDNYRSMLKALEYCAKMLDDDGGKRQGIFYSDALSPDSDDVTALEYIKDVINTVKRGKS